MDITKDFLWAGISFVSATLNWNLLGIYVRCCCVWK